MIATLDDPVLRDVQDLKERAWAEVAHLPLDQALEQRLQTAMAFSLVNALEKATAECEALGMSDVLRP